MYSTNEGGGGEASTNYRGPADRKCARGLTILYMFSFSVVSLIVICTNYPFSPNSRNSAPDSKSRTYLLPVPASPNHHFNSSEDTAFTEVHVGPSAEDCMLEAKRGAILAIAAGHPKRTGLSRRARWNMTLGEYTAI